MGELAVLVPSRGRPANVERLYEAMDRTCRAGTTLIVGVDADDPHLSAYEALGRPLVVRDGLRQVVAWLNELAVPAAREYPLLGHFGDDNLPVTDGWDEHIIESLRSQPFCFADDEYEGRPPGSLCCHIFMRSQVVRALGYMGPPCLRHMYVDPVWMAWGEALGIEFLADVKIPHLHYSVGKAEGDATYTASLAITETDCEAFNAYCRDPEGLNRDIRRIKAGAPTFTADEYENFRAFHNIPA